MERKNFSKLAKQIRGVSYKPEDLHENLDENSVTLLRANNIFDGKINFDDVVYVDKSKVTREQYLCKGDILVCASSGSKQLVGKAASFNFDIECTFGAFCKVVRPNQDVANYLSVYFQSNAYRRKISEVAIGANINNIRNEHIDALELPIGSNAENEKVVASFSLLQQIIDGRKQQLHKLDELVKARFVEMMDSAELSDEMTIEQITSCVKVGFVGTCETHYTDNSGIPMLRTGNITDHGIDMRELKYVTLKFHESNKKSQIHNGDLLIARHGSNGQANVYEGPEAQCLNAVVIVPNQSIAKSKFLAALINSPMVKKQIDRYLVGSTQHVVNTKSIANLVVRLPSLQMQEKFENFVEQADKSKIAVQKALDEAQLLFDSLMQQYFS